LEESRRDAENQDFNHKRAANAGGAWSIISTIESMLKEI